ncbi:MAG: ABC transporter ATP-binding protein [Bacteroidota bacterium]
MNAFLQIQNISCGYPSKFMLNNISFELEKGSFTGIIGPNGSGKSTLFKGICGDLPLKNGNILFQGFDISKLSLVEKAKKIAVVSQYIDSIDISVEDYVLMGRIPYRNFLHFFESKDDIELSNKYMNLTGVYQYKDKLMSELSGGEQQLAAIARALTQQPDILLLDEPTSHLDISHQVQVLNLLQHLNEELKLTILMIIHDLNLASEYCNHLIMMKLGDIFKSGTPNEVLVYNNIEEVYNTVVITLENPLSKKPAIFLISEKVLKKSSTQ